MGDHTDATGNNATSFSHKTKAIGIASTSNGYFSRAIGNYAASCCCGSANAIVSTVFGYNNISNGLYGTSVGLINDTLVGIQTSTPANNPLLWLVAVISPTIITAVPHFTDGMD